MESNNLSKKMEMIIYENEKVIQTMGKDVDVSGLIKAMDEFQQEANAKLSKIIRDLCETVGFEKLDNISDSSDEDDEEDTSDIPKKKKR